MTRWIEPSTANGHWHKIICREGCHSVLVVSAIGLTDGQAEAALRQVAAHKDWYPLNRYDWWCEHCGKARLQRRDMRALEAEREQLRLKQIDHPGRRAA